MTPRSATAYPLHINQSKDPTVAAHECDTKQTPSMNLFTHDPCAQSNENHQVSGANIGPHTNTRRQKSTGIYRCRLCCGCELDFEPHDLLHHSRPTGHYGDSLATVRTHRGARPLMTLFKERKRRPNLYSVCVRLTNHN